MISCMNNFLYIIFAGVDDQYSIITVTGRSQQHLKWKPASVSHFCNQTITEHMFGINFNKSYRLNNNNNINNADEDDNDNNAINNNSSDDRYRIVLYQDIIEDTFNTTMKIHNWMGVSGNENADEQSDVQRVNNVIHQLMIEDNDQANKFKKQTAYTTKRPKMHCFDCGHEIESQLPETCQQLIHMLDLKCCGT